MNKSTTDKFVVTEAMMNKVVVNTNVTPPRNVRKSGLTNKYQAIYDVVKELEPVGLDSGDGWISVDLPTHGLNNGQVVSTFVVVTGAIRNCVISSFGKTCRAQVQRDHESAPYGFVRLYARVVRK